MQISEEAIKLKVSGTLEREGVCLMFIIHSHCLKENEKKITRQWQRTEGGKTILIRGLR